MVASSPLALGLREFPMTLVIMAVCIGLFLWQLATGVDPNQPSNNDLIMWGANFLPLTLDGGIWRMVTSLFLHIGLMHLMFNMFALYYFGQIAERMFGSFNLLALFILSGMGGNVLNNSLGWLNFLHGEPPIVSAGASGGIMGIGMALLVTTLFKTPINHLQLSFGSIFMVMVINLSYGFLVGGIDNAGHIGGAMVGGLMGLIYVWQYRLLVSKQSNHQALSVQFMPKRIVPNTTLVMMSYALLLVLFLIIYWYLHTSLVNLLLTTAPPSILPAH